jgi:muramoyltetrapeptide carboxypeptidase
MRRRHFFKTAAQCAALHAAAPWAALFPQHSAMPDSKRLLKPARLQAGMTIGLIAPASPFSPEKLEATRRNMAALGLSILEGPNLHARMGYLAGSDAQRLADLHWAFQNPDVDAVWCIRGGYGCARLLPEVDYDLVRQNPKPFIGYSDITALHLAIQQRARLVTFHGPVGASDFPESTLRHFRAALMEPVEGYTLRVPDATETLPGDEYRPFLIRPGRAEGVLTGGNLTLLAALVGTPFAPSYRGKIVFIEDVGEQPYRIDRMLVQLLQGSDLGEAAGIALGVFADCRPKGESPSLSLEETLRLCLGPLSMPVLHGIPFGHVPQQATFAYGMRAALDADAGTLQFLESGVD